MLNRGMTIEEIVKQTRFNRNQVSAAQFNYFTYSFGKVIFLRNKSEFTPIQDAGFKRLQLIEQLTEIPELEINTYWVTENDTLVRYRFGDYLPDIYKDLTNTETV